jgi:hypothetical protein
MEPEYLLSSSQKTATGSHTTNCNVVVMQSSDRSLRKVVSSVLNFRLIFLYTCFNAYVV